MDRITVSACPVCDGKPKFLDSKVLYNLDTLNTQVSVSFAACLQCGFVFQADPLSWDSLAEYYRSSPRYRSASNDSIDRILCCNQLQFIEETGQMKGCTVLDIGADMGKMLDLMADRYGCETSYMEENEAAIQYLRAHKRHTEVPNLDEAGHYDWCILSQVLEHIVNPISFLEKIREHLNKDGNLLIEVPNHSFWDDRDYGFSFEHVNYFSPSTLIRALYQAGFIVTKLAITSHERYFSGKIRIIRVIATPMPTPVQSQLINVIQEHEKREFGNRFRAAEELANKFCVNGRPSLALYGAAELANLLFSNTKVGSSNLAAIFDTDQRKHGQDFHGFIVADADQHSTKNVQAILVLSSAEKTITDHLRERGYTGEIIGWSQLKQIESVVGSS